MGTIGAYFFEHDAESWRLTARQDAAANSALDAPGKANPRPGSGKDEQLLPLEKVKQQAVYQVVQGLLEPISGSNPVSAL